MLPYAPLCIVGLGALALALASRQRADDDALQIGRTVWCAAVAVSLALDARGGAPSEVSGLLMLVGAGALAVPAAGFERVHGLGPSPVGLMLALALLALTIGVEPSSSMLTLSPWLRLAVLLVLLVGVALLVGRMLISWDARRGAPGLSRTLPTLAACLLVIAWLRVGFGDAAAASPYAGWPALVTPFALLLLIGSCARAALAGSVGAFVRDAFLAHLALLFISLAASAEQLAAAPSVIAQLALALALGTALLTWAEAGSASEHARGLGRVGGALVLLGAPLTPGFGPRVALLEQAAEMRFAPVVLSVLLMSTGLLGIAALRVLLARAACENVPGVDVGPSGPGTTGA